MDILVIEDNPLKREKIVEYLNQKSGLNIQEAASYNSGLTLAQERKFDLLILDMSMPTFDRSDSTHGGRFRAVAGKEIVARLKRSNKLVPFVVLTGFTDFRTDTQNISLEEIDSILAGLGEIYKGCVFFDSTNSVWKEKLSLVLETL
ncbi:response regulator [Pseudomonas sp. 2023EL-01195]|uniref:response regulator n=1 Tax=Pseudomonas sp. 2023EL-01195 TaxID=3088134 RepID=UPI00296B1564|nr:response regulator [Pseudomonas sp. 2023EL-01195]MDW3713384.1 response regulator [Pseudomonas sp. 2023EL-01195]